VTSVDGQNVNLIGRTLGVYRLDALLGAGGMAEVYRAYDTKLQREVAVKVLPASLALDPGYVERFRSEGRQVAALNHPHIVPVYQFGEEGGLLFLVMPVLKESLRDRLDRERRLSPSEATRLAVQIASGLDAAHARGLVHRDVKPENILLNNEGRALLTDFGIAREIAFLRETGVARTLAASGLPVGTPEYMAPEQLRGLPVDQKADVYALGAVLYELLTGVVPHDAATPYEVAALVLTAPTPAPSAHNPQIWPELDGVVLRSLAKSPEQRFADARSFALALRQVVVDRGRPTAAAVPSVRWTQYAPPLGAANVLEAPTGSGPLNPLQASGPNPVVMGVPAIDVEATQPPAPSLRATNSAVFGGAMTDSFADVTLADLPLNAGASAAGGGFGAGGFGGDTAKRTRVALAQPRRRNFFLLMSAGVLLAIALGILGAATLNGFNPFGGGTTSSPIGGTGAHNQTTATVKPPATPKPTATATTAPTATATAVPIPPPLAFDPATINPFPFGRKNCAGQVNITNNGAQTVGWQWQSASPPLSSLQYDINGSFFSHMQPGNPHDSSLAPGATDVVYFTYTCDANQQHTVPVTDSLQNTYTLTVNAPQNQNGG